MKKREDHVRGILGIKIAVFFILLGCGGLGGDVPAADTPAPAGVVVATGTFGGANDYDVSGSVFIYRNQADYTLRIEALATPALLGMTLVLKSDGLIVLQTGLVSSDGASNYSITDNSRTNWSSVEIRSFEDNVIGIAVLTLRE